MMDIKGLFVWTLGSVIRVIQLISTRKKPFQSLGSWFIGSRVITGFLQLLGSFGSLVFYLFLVSISFVYTSRKLVTMGLSGNTSDKNPKPIYVIKRISDLCEWLLKSVTQWFDQLDHQSSFVCVSVSRITWINWSVIRFSKQIAPNKYQAYKTNEGFIIYINFFLSLTLHYRIGFGQILIQTLMKKIRYQDLHYHQLLKHQ